jgi:hypothetical protein
MTNHQSTATSSDIQARVRASLGTAGLAEGKDFFLGEADNGTHYVILDLVWQDTLTESLLLACSAAHGREWGVLVRAFDPDKDDFRPMVEVSGGGFSYLGGGDSVHATVVAAYQSALRTAGNGPESARA